MARSSRRAQAEAEAGALGRARGWRLGVRYALLIFVAVLVLFPIYVMVVAALKPRGTVLKQPLLPTSVTTRTLTDAWSEGHLSRYLVNSGVVAVLVTVAQLTTSVLSAYAFVFLRFPLRRVLFVVFIATLLVPLEATLVVNLRTIESLGWKNSFQALAVPFFATAFGTFLLRQVFLTIPTDLKEAAAMDGLGHWGFLREVAVPLARPTMGALALFAFLGSWNSYLWPVLSTTDQNFYTLQSGLRQLAAASIDRPNLVMAGTVIAAVPVFAVLLVFQRQLVRGLTAGAVKG